MLVLFPVGVMANGSATYPLFADQDIKVGYVEVTDNGTDLTVKYVIDDPDWCLEATHLDVQVDPEDFPQTQKGNPKVGKFAYGDVDLGCASRNGSPS